MAFIPEKTNVYAVLRRAPSILLKTMPSMYNQIWNTD